MSKIVRLTSENVKRLYAVEIEPEGNVIVVGGDNGHGKTSVLDSIVMALGGEKYVPPEPIRKGASKARVVVETEDLVVSRSFTGKGTYLKVEGKDGTKYGSPQAVLDALVGSLSFDPLEFMRMDVKGQVATLRTLLGLDFSELDAEREQVYNQRTQANAEVRQQQDALKALPTAPEGTPDAEVSVTDLSDQLEEVRLRNLALKEEQDELYEAREENRQRRERAAELQEQLTALLADADEADEQISDMAAKLEGREPEPVDALREQIRNAEAINAAVRQENARKEAVTALRQKKAQAEALTADLEAIDEEKRAAIAAAHFPVEGMAFGAEGVILNEVPLEQASSAEQLRVSTAMGFAMNPDLRVLLIRDGSLLDETSLRLVAEMALAADGQVWIERVGHGKEAQVVIVDGRVEGADEADEAAEEVE